MFIIILRISASNASEMFFFGGRGGGDLVHTKVSMTTQSGRCTGVIASSAHSFFCYKNIEAEICEILRIFLE